MARRRRRSRAAGPSYLALGLIAALVIAAGTGIAVVALSRPPRRLDDQVLEEPMSPLPEGPQQPAAPQSVAVGEPAPSGEAAPTEAGPDTESEAGPDEEPAPAPLQPSEMRAPEDYPVPVRIYPLPPSFRKWSRRKGGVIDAIILHYTDGKNPDAWATAKHAVEGSRKASFHFAIGKDGQVVRLVPESMAAWQCSGWNDRGIGIEHCAYEHEQMTPAQEQASVALIKHLVSVYRIPISNIMGHRFARQALAGAKGLAETDCPADLFGPRTDPEHDQALITAWLERNGILPPKGVA